MAGVGGIPAGGTTAPLTGAPSGLDRVGGSEADLFGLQFSKHAARRLEQRGVSIDPIQLERLERAVGQAEAKGSKDSLILLDELALVVSVQNRTVVTAVDEASRKENVFTNIDSVVIAQ